MALIGARLFAQTPSSVSADQSFAGQWRDSLLSRQKSDCDRGVQAERELAHPNRRDDLIGSAAPGGLAELETKGARLVEWGLISDESNE